MADFSIGDKLRVTLFGQSHGPAVGCVVDGFPAGQAIDWDAVNAFLDTARRTGFGSEVAVGYLAAEENAITTVRMVMTGLLSGIDPERLKERLRDTYV